MRRFGSIQNIYGRPVFILERFVRLQANSSSTTMTAILDYLRRLWQRWFPAPPAAPEPTLEPEPETAEKSVDVPPSTVDLQLPIPVEWFAAAAGRRYGESADSYAGLRRV